MVHDSGSVVEGQWYCVHKKNNMAKEKVIRLSHRMLVHQQKSEDPVLHDQISLLAWPNGIGDN